MTQLVSINSQLKEKGCDKPTLETDKAAVLNLEKGT
jgi:hypothetical protein